MLCHTEDHIMYYCNYHAVAHSVSLFGVTVALLRNYLTRSFLSWDIMKGHDKVKSLFLETIIICIFFAKYYPYWIIPLAVHVMELATWNGIPFVLAYILEAGLQLCTCICTEF